MSQLVREIAQGIIDRADPHDYIRPRVVEAVSALNPTRARYSPGGFIDVELGFDGLQRLVRVHLWKTEGAPPLDQAPHNHRNRVDSLILHGLFHNTEYNLAPDGDHVSYDAFCMAEEVEKCPTPRRVTASVRSNEILHPGDFYTAPNGTYHSADTDGFAATVAVFSDWTTDPCRIVQNTPLFDPTSGEKGIPNEQVVRRYLTEAGLLSSFFSRR